MIPPGLKSPALEVVGEEDLGSLTKNRKILRSSDAHQLGAILERQFYLPEQNPDPQEIIAFLRAK
jgi:hypothetical protein